MYEEFINSIKNNRDKVQRISSETIRPNINEVHLWTPKNLGDYFRSLNPFYLCLADELENNNINGQTFCLMNADQVKKYTQHQSMIDYSLAINSQSCSKLHTSRLTREWETLKNMYDKYAPKPTVYNVIDITTTNKSFPVRTFESNGITFHIF